MIESDAVQQQERVSKTAIELLISRGHEFEAMFLLRSMTELSIPSWDVVFPISGGEGEFNIYDYLLVISVPAEHFDTATGMLTEQRSSNIEQAYKDAIQSASSSFEHINAFSIQIRAALSEQFEGWRSTLEAGIKGDTEPLNQGTLGPHHGNFSWNGLRFRSQSEIAVSRELSSRKILYFPLPAAVRGITKLEPDFLICHKGQWGVLEVHGEPFHPPERNVEEQKRARWLEFGGVITVQSFDSGRCFNDASSVVDEFLQLLETKG